MMVHGVNLHEKPDLPDLQSCVISGTILEQIGTFKIAFIQTEEGKGLRLYFIYFFCCCFSHFRGLEDRRIQ